MISRYTLQVLTSLHLKGLLACFMFLVAVLHADTNVLDLDTNRNGLYEDFERIELLRALQKIDNSLGDNFDSNADGKVTVLEQTNGRHPLSKLFDSERVVASQDKIPWGIDIFPEWIVTAFYQEDIAIGPVAMHQARGITNIQANASPQDDTPERLADGGGVYFPANSAARLTFPGNQEALWSYRWCLLTFRLDAESGSGGDTILLDVNQGKGGFRSTPKVWFSQDEGLVVQFVGERIGELDTRVFRTHDLVTDGVGWNVLVCGLRYGQIYAELNGKPLQTIQPQPPRFSGARHDNKYTSYIGDANDENCAWAYDAIVFGLTEPSEAMVDKLTGWAAHRLAFSQRLPESHPYRLKQPVLDEEDFPDRYIHDDNAWLAWGESIRQKSITRVNSGGPRKQPEGFERVFFDDFDRDRVSPSATGNAELWMGPGFNTAVGKNAILATPGRSNQPNVYDHDATNELQYLSLMHERGRWWGSALYTVNNLGYGYSWAGPKIVRIRCKFPSIPQDELAGGLFPAFWSYSPEWLFWRTENRIEIDWFEFDGKVGDWMNGLSSHVHYVHLKNDFVKNPNRYKSLKAYGGQMTEAKTNIPGGIYAWDGRFHSWEFVVEEEMTFVNVTYYDAEGMEHWVELYRCPTPAPYLEDLDLQLDYALKANNGTPSDNARQDFIVDAVEVLQKSEQLAQVPKPFNALPNLHGKISAGEVITCEANVDGVTDLRYYWFADGYPLTWGPSNTYMVTSDDVGKAIRCMVKAVGAVNAPVAWSAPLR